MAAPAWQVRPAHSLGLPTSGPEMQSVAGPTQNPGNWHPLPSPPFAVNFSEASSTTQRDVGDSSVNSAGSTHQSVSCAQLSMPPPHGALPPGQQTIPPGQGLRSPGQSTMPPGQPPPGLSLGALQPGMYCRPSLPGGSYPPPPSSFSGNRWAVQQPGPSSTLLPAGGARPSADPFSLGTSPGQPPSASSNVVMSQSPGVAPGPPLPQSSFQGYPALCPPQMPMWMLSQQQGGSLQSQAYAPFIGFSGYAMPFNRPVRPSAPYQESPGTYPQVQPMHAGTGTSVANPPNAWGGQSSSGMVASPLQPAAKEVGLASATGVASQLSAISAPATSEEKNGESGDFGSHTEKDQTAEAASLGEEWTAHRTADGRVYYYESISGQSTYERPAGFKGEVDKVTAQPTPVSWERLTGTDWALVTTDDSKKYYYNTITQATSWQVPQEVAQLRKDQAEESSARRGADPGLATTEKSTVSFSLNVPAAAAGGREAVGHKGVPAAIGSSALDLIKKKLQDVGTPVSVAPNAITNGVLIPEVHNGKAVIIENSKEKQLSSDSSSDSEDDEPGPTKEERITQFKEMLKEKGVAPFSKWEKELPKVIFDARFKAIQSYTERRSIFEHYVRNRADEERKEKRAAQKAAVEGFKQLLVEAAKTINHSTDYESFAKVWSSDPRFEALDRKDREALLQERVLPLRKAEDKRLKSEFAAAVGGFKAMLVEKGEITTITRWSKVKDGMRHDPRYSAVKHEDREGLFNLYVGELRAAEQEAERAAKAKRDEEEKLKERDREIRKRKEREEQEVERVRSKARRKEAISGFQTLLTEKIKDPEASWTEARVKLGKDPQGRASNPELDFGERERLFREHVNDLYARAVREYRLLLADVITVEAASKQLEAGKNILTTWSEAKKLIKADPRYARTPRRERESWWRRYADDVQRRLRAQKPENGASNSSASKIVSELRKPSPGPRRNHRM